jgi:histidyl-tRNA synthetase
MERFLMMVDAVAEPEAPPRRGVAAIALGAQARTVVAPLVAELRRQLDAPVFADYNDRKLLAHLKNADKQRARYALIVGSDELAAGELVLRDLEDRSDRRVPLGESGVLIELLGEAER